MAAAGAAGVVPVTIAGEDFDADKFNPHGLTAWEDAELGTRVWIVNHPRGESYDTVEQFAWHPGTATLQHERSIRDAAFHRLNDVVAVSRTHFYASNFLRTHVDAEIMLGPLFSLGSVLFYDEAF